MVYRFNLFMKTNLHIDRLALANRRHTKRHRHLARLWVSTNEPFFPEGIQIQRIAVRSALGFVFRHVQRCNKAAISGGNVRRETKGDRFRVRPQHEYLLTPTVCPCTVVSTGTTTTAFQLLGNGKPQPLSGRVNRRYTFYKQERS